MELKNSTILITGGTSGIGLELVKQLLAKGANIIVTGRNLDTLNETKKKFPKVHTFQSDVTKPQDIEQLYKQVTTQFPELNIIINSAGIMRNIDLQDTSLGLENITREIETNLSGTIRINYQFLPHLKTKKLAAIVNISSGLAFVPFPISPVYSATKSGIHAYTQILRLQLKNTSVKVFEIAPPGTDTPLSEKLGGYISKDQLMKVDEMVRKSISGIEKDKFEIRPG
ncbi:MAG: SDR family oxidoreductase, partial [Rhabdochlamydiaceae bacterium]